MICAIYCRLSKEDMYAGDQPDSLRESESIQNQKSLLIQYAISQQWEIYGIFCDDDYSGADAERPEWNTMLEAARAGKFSVVLCKNQSRFTRDLEMVEKYIHGLFPLWGIRFVAVLDNVDTAVKGNKKARQINGLINEWYLEDLSENIRAVFDQKRRAGKYIGSFPVYGYAKDPADHNHLVVDEEAARTVQKIFSLFIGGMGTRGIASYLNENGVLNPSKYKQAKGQGYVNGRERTGQGVWHSTTVGRIIKNRTYLGTLVQGTKKKASYKSKKLLDVPKEDWICVEGVHEAIIDGETFDAAQRRIRKHTRSGGTGEAHVLSGILRCADCGGGMIKVSNVYKGQKRLYLQCGRYAETRSNPQCTRHSIRLEYLTEAVEERIRYHVNALYQPGDLSRFRVEDEGDRRSLGLNKELAATGQQIAKLSAAIASLYMDKVAGVLSPEQFAEMNLSFLEQREKLKKRMCMLEQDLAALHSGGTDEDAQIAEARKLLTLNTIGRELFDLLIHRVEVGERAVGENVQEVCIRWNI